MVRLVPIQLKDITLPSKFEDCLHKATVNAHIKIGSAETEYSIPLKENGSQDPLVDLVDACVKTIQLVIPIDHEEIQERQFITTIGLTVHLVDLAEYSIC